MVAKAKNSVRAHKGRLDDAVFAVIHVLAGLLWTINAIAEKCNCDWHTVKRALVSTVRPSERTKRLPPKMVTAAKAALLLRRRRLKSLSQIMQTRIGPPPTRYVYTRKKYQSCAQLSRELHARHGGPTVSKSTVLRDMGAVGCVSKNRPKGPMREATDPADRVAFSKNTLKSKHGAWGGILFSDEKWANTNDHGLPMEFCTPEEQATRRVYDRYAKSVHVWGAIGVGVKHLIVLPKGNINATNYVKNSLSKSRHILRGKTLMQDGARPHTAKSTMKWLGDNKFDVLPGWPARSPDLNPIENLWAIISRRVGSRQPTDEAELALFFVEEWNAIPQSVIDKLVLSFEGRLKECIARNGETIATKSKDR